MTEEDRVERILVVIRVVVAAAEAAQRERDAKVVERLLGHSGREIARSIREGK